MGGSAGDPRPPGGQLIIYRDGATRLQVRLEGQSIWLTQRLLAELYQISVPTVNEHLANIYAEGELAAEATIRKFRIVQREGSRDVSRNIERYNLNAILAVGYRVRSHRGTAFRQWARPRPIKSPSPGRMAERPSPSGAQVSSPAWQRREGGRRRRGNPVRGGGYSSACCGRITSALARALPWVVACSPG